MHFYVKDFTNFPEPWLSPRIYGDKLIH